MTLGLSYKPGGGAYTGMCHLTGYGFWPLCPKQGIYFFVSVLNSVFFWSFILKKDLK